MPRTRTPENPMAFNTRDTRECREQCITVDQVFALLGSSDCARDMACLLLPSTISIDALFPRNFLVTGSDRMELCEAVY